MARTKWINIEAELEYAHVFEDNRDMGNDKVNHKDIDGMYKVTVIVDDETKQKMLAAGVPDGSKPMQAQWKTTEDGRWKYTLKRKHLNKAAPGLGGAPVVIDYKKTAETDEVHEWDSDMKLGNGTKAMVKFQVYSNPNGSTSITLDKIGVLDYVEYVPNNEGVLVSEAGEFLF